MLSFYLSLVESEEEKSLITELYNKYERLMYGVALEILHNSHNAEDAVHEAFLRIIKNISKLSFENDIKTKALLVIIVKNVSINMYNKDKRSEPSDVLEEIIEDEGGFNEYSRLEKPAVSFLIKELPEELRQIIVLRYIFETDVKTISETLGIVPTTVYARIRKAREAMRKHLEKYNEEIK